MADDQWRRITVGFTEDQWLWLTDPGTLQGRRIGQFVRHLVDQARNESGAKT